VAGEITSGTRASAPETPMQTTQQGMLACRGMDRLGMGFNGV